jgi:hypothetical protein
MMRKMKEVKDLEMQVVMSQIAEVRKTYQTDKSNDAKLNIL